MPDMKKNYKIIIYKIQILNNYLKIINISYFFLSNIAFYHLHIIFYQI